MKTRWLRLLSALVLMPPIAAAQAQDGFYFGLEIGAVSAPGLDTSSTGNDVSTGSSAPTSISSTLPARPR